MVVTMGDIYKDSCRAEFRKFGSKNKVRKVLTTLAGSHILRGAVIGAGVTVAARGLAGGRAAGNVMSEQYGEQIRHRATRAGVGAGLVSGLKDREYLVGGAIVGAGLGGITRIQANSLKQGARNLAATFSPLAKNMSKKTKSRIKTAGRAALTVGLGLGVTRLAGSTTSYLANSNVPEMEAELRRNQAARQWARQNPANNSIPSSRPRLSSGR